MKQMKLSKTVGKENKDLQNFYKEVGLLQRLKHPKIVSYIGYKQDGNTIEIYMEYMTGKRLLFGVLLSVCLCL